MIAIRENVVGFISSFAPVIGCCAIAGIAICSATSYHAVRAMHAETDEGYRRADIQIDRSLFLTEEQLEEKFRALNGVDRRASKD